MKHRLFALCMLTLAVISCNIPSLLTPAPQTETPIVLPTATVDTGGVVTFNNVSFTLPLGVANDAAADMIPAVTDPGNSPSWDVAPAHLKFTLSGYQLQNTFHEPQILVYPADEYTQLNSGAADQIQRLKAILAGTAPSKEALPVIPSFNASQQIASQIKLVDFQSGSGVRMLTQYAQYPAPINNHDLFYHFQGLTKDGKYYVIAVLPVTSSILAEDEKPAAEVPAGGVPIPQATGPDQAYYNAVTKVLDAMYEDSFNPSLFQLDALIQSITVIPQ